MVEQGLNLTEANLLVVDDTPDSLRLLTQILQHQGYKVRPVTDGQRALQAVQSTLPDLIILDIMMPDMDGYEVCTRLKENEQTREIPIIFLSALGETGHKTKGFAVGGVDFITKPFQVAEVVARIRTHLTVRAMQKQLQQQNVQLQQEITARQQTEEALRRYVLELETSNAELDAFAYTVAHDLRSPLSVITGFSDLLETFWEKMSPGEVRDRLHRIGRGGKKMSDIVQALLLLARVRKMEDVQFAPLDMAAIVSEVRSRLAHLEEECGAEIAVSQEWPAAVGYGPWVEEVWVNYLSNAFKYGGRPEEKIPPRIELGCDSPEDSIENGSHARFWVRDNGAGLSSEQQARLFMPFERLDQGQRVEGHGLGLSIVRRIVEKLGGEVGIESDLGQGSCFYFTLPASLESSHKNLSSSLIL